MVKRILLVSFLGLWLGAGLVAQAGEEKMESFKGWFIEPETCGEGFTFHDETKNQNYQITQQGLAEAYRGHEVVIRGTLENSYLNIKSIEAVDTK